jgi:3-phosphoshikimate 1-carboxyvinyltransferase
MKWIVRPSRLSGVIAIPPSKSHTIRALLVATLADGVSTIRRPLVQGDGASAIRAAKAMGSNISPHGNDLIISGIGMRYDEGLDLFDMGNSGTSTNLFMSVAALGKRQRRFDGDASLRSRPFRHLLTALKQLGASYTLESPDPARDLPFTIQGPLCGGKTTVNGVSSQYVSSLLFTCPLLSGDTEITVENIHERPYIELTLWWLKKQGIAVEHAPDFSSFTVRGGQRYHPFDLAIPSDFSGATFAACAAAMGNASLTLTGLDFSDPQGDKRVFDVLRKMGATVSHDSVGATVTGPDALQAATIDLNTMPDSLPAIAAAASTAKGETHIVNVAHARIKETDRITVMARELAKMGADITEREDGLVIRGGKLRGAQVQGHDDHRVVMALALAGMNSEGETIIDTAEAAEVTYPSFAEDFRKLGARIETVDG